MMNSKRVLGIFGRAQEVVCEFGPAVVEHCVPHRLPIAAVASPVVKLIEDVLRLVQAIRRMLTHGVVVAIPIYIQ